DKNPNYDVKEHFLLSWIPLSHFLRIDSLGESHSTNQQTSRRQSSARSRRPAQTGSDLRPTTTRAPRAAPRCLLPRARHIRSMARAKTSRSTPKPESRK